MLIFYNKKICSGAVAVGLTFLLPVDRLYSALVFFFSYSWLSKIVQFQMNAYSKMSTETIYVQTLYICISGVFKRKWEVCAILNIWYTYLDSEEKLLYTYTFIWTRCIMNNIRDFVNRGFVLQVLVLYIIMYASILLQRHLYIYV